MNTLEVLINTIHSAPALLGKLLWNDELLLFSRGEEGRAYAGNVYKFFFLFQIQSSSCLKHASIWLLWFKVEEGEGRRREGQKPDLQVVVCINELLS